MGEAKRRKAVDPTYGRIPKLGRGLVISSPIEVEIEQNILRTTSYALDPQELRFALLFWDRLAWPTYRNFHFVSGRDATFLEDAGILIRPNYGLLQGELSEALVQAHVNAFFDLDQGEPGLWALGQGVNSLLVRDRVLEVGRGALVELTRAIPVPNKDVPLNDILEFRLKRRDELIALRNDIDSLFVSANNAADKQFELQRHIAQIDKACADLLKLGKEWNHPFRLSDLKSSFELQPFAALAAGTGAWQWGVSYGMPLSAKVTLAAVGGAAASIKINRDFGLRRTRLRTNPYRYVYSFHDEIF